MRSTKLPVLPALLAALAVAGCRDEDPIEELEARSQQAVSMVADAGFAEWDVDRDARLANAEFRTWMGGAGVYDRWAGEDEEMDAEELGEGALRTWDVDGDARLTGAEWRKGAARWLGEEDHGAFADWDMDGGGSLDGGELGEGFERTGLFGEWDRNDDDLLQEDEFREGAFGVWDADGDGFISEEEWRAGYGAWSA